MTPFKKKKMEFSKQPSKPHLKTLGPNTIAKALQLILLFSENEGQRGTLLFIKGTYSKEKLYNNYY